MNQGHDMTTVEYIAAQREQAISDMKTTAKQRALGPIEFRDNKGEWHVFELLETPTRAANPNK